MKPVILYTQPDCPPCQITKLFLNDRGVRYEEKNIAEDDSAKNEWQTRWNASSTPTVVVHNEAVTGFDLEKLTSVLNKYGM
ncbi:glutaredoxin family protein [Bacillus badius]|uniref:Glutaredoxin family protein n=1 Tax=Bacillus badius TaxID=1455 RepID=A0ABR5B089_BACBA|nr:glutaredoxin family protein [Bacillus badius]KIL73395.1 glutaredoxin family protein [Bacillus badius]KIL80405.1 glutaredoxin family protein [Bacillus badius]KZO01512.1 NrdH-redoxin [Bacillus badius]KZR57224.1 NrdH-redoxin [Bacillus badius]MED0667154.1 glutaredoxin family protein [Bacillus badius]